MAIIKIRNAAIDLDAAEIPNIDASKITTGSLGADRIPSLAASKIGSGTFADARIAASNVSQHATSFDDNAIVNDISTLALRSATSENAIAYNTNSSFVDVFQDASGIASNTDAPRNSAEFVSTVIQEVAPFSNDSNTIMLLHMDNNVTDSSSNGITITNHNSATFSTSEKKLGTHGLVLNGSNQYLSTPDIEGVDNSVVAPSTGDYTLEGWFKYYQVANSNYTDRLYAIGNNGTPASGGTPMLSLGYQNSTTMNYWGDVGAVNHNFTAPSQDTNWHHYTTMRVSGTTYSYIDGVQKDSTTNFDDSNFYNNGNIFIGARSDSSSEFFYGYVDEVRYSNTARYTTGSNGSTQFTPNYVNVANATGNFISNTITAPSSTSKMGAIITYQDYAGTNTLNTDIVLQLSADNGSNFATATMTALPDFATGIKMAKVNDLSVTAGTQLKYKISFANQSGSKEARIRGVSLQY